MDKGQSAKRDHALLSASGAKRWLNCTPSAKEEAEVEDSGSTFAEEGTLAHALAARKLKKIYGRDHTCEDREIEQLKGKYHCLDMDVHVENYVDFVMTAFQEAQTHSEAGGVKPELRIEQRLDFSRYVPGGFGTGDAVIVSDGHIHVIDLKYGKGVRVKAENNEQMMLYALGVLDLFDYAYNIKSVTMTIFQPRIGNVASHRMFTSDLLRWGNSTVWPLAQVAYRGLGAKHPGEWCRFCKVKDNCTRLAESSVAQFLMYDAKTVDTGQMARLLHVLPRIRDWADAIQSRAVREATEGTTIPGWKMVSGRSTRKVTDPEGMARTMRDVLELTEEDIWKPREIQSITSIEKTIGKKKFEEHLSAFVARTAGKPVLAAEDDARDPLARGFDGIDMSEYIEQ